MKPNLISFRTFSICFALLLSFSFDRCSDKCRIKTKYVYYSPVYMTTSEIKAAVGMNSTRDIKKLGRIYTKDGILFVNEVGEGIHIIDNHDPAKPKPLGFLTIPGNFDLAIQGNTLYADSYIDLVALDISAIPTVKEVGRIEGLFHTYNNYGFSIDPQKGILTSWKQEANISVMQSECEAQVQSWGGIYYQGGIAMANDSYSAAAVVVPTNSTGTGGSMARFAIIDHYMYSLDGSNMEVIDISNETKPVAGKPINVAWDVETLFPYGKNLFVGGRAGMYIFDMSIPSQPSLVSIYNHIQSCDPVVVDGNYAYVTLYSGGICHVKTNQLEVIDITDLKAPRLVKVYPMTNPHGLGIDHGTLFICDGDDGLKIFDASDPLTISEHSLAHYGRINALDIIPLDHVAMMIGSDGIYQYDYADVKNIKLLSKISIVKP